MKRSIIIMLCAVLPMLCVAQKKPVALKPYAAAEVKAAEKDADTEFKAFNYTGALPVYERLAITDPSNVVYNYRLGLCYLLTNIAKNKALNYLEIVADADPKAKPKDILFDLAKAYHYAGQYDAAIETFEAYRVQKSGNVDPKLKFNDWVEWSTNANKLTASPVSCTFTNLSKTINSAQADYRPVMGAADTIVYFSSKRKGTTGGLTDDLGESPADIYFFTQNDTSRSKAKSAGIAINTEFYEETMFLNMNGDRILIYREGPESNGDIYIADLTGKTWGKPVLAGKDFQTKLLETGACLSPDGLTLYFSAESLDGKTGKDIYRCTRTESTSWGKPEKLDQTINTKGDEDMPYLWYDGKTLFFSSTGHNSMGGLDVFRSVMKDPREGFSKPENIGYPLNTVYDDYNIALTCDASTVYLAAVRDSGIGDYDLYKVELSTPLVSNPMCWLQGKGITSAGTPAKGAFVVITEKAGGAAVAKIEANESTGRFDVALAPGTYSVVLKHPKAGRTEATVTIAPGDKKFVLDLLFP